MTTYKKVQYDGNKIQVDSAIRDGNGKQIDTNYQAKLVSGTNIKTINNESILGSGNITIQAGGSWTLATNTTLKDYIIPVSKDSNDYTINVTKNIKLELIGNNSTVTTYINKGVYTGRVMNLGLCTPQFVGAYNFPTHPTQLFSGVEISNFWGDGNVITSMDIWIFIRLGDSYQTVYNYSMSNNNTVIVNKQYTDNNITLTDGYHYRLWYMD